MRKKSRVLVSVFLILCLLSGCKDSKVKETPTSTRMPTPSLSTAVTPNPFDSMSALTVVPSRTAEMPIYTISGDFTELTAVTALVDEGEKITEQVISEAVVTALEDCAIYVVVNYVEQRNGVVVVDFDAAAPPVCQVGASIEGLILDAFGQSLLDNLSGCSGVSFTVDGEAYVSGHFAFGKEDIYMRR